MATGKKKAAGTASGSEAVDAFLANLDHPLKPAIEAVRAIILSADPRISESVKWNAPSFSLSEHFATFFLRSADSVQVVFHTGAKARSGAVSMEIDAPAGILRWVAKDRCLLTLRNMEEVRAQREALVSVVRQWLRAFEE